MHRGGAEAQDQAQGLWTCWSHACIQCPQDRPGQTFPLPESQFLSLAPQLELSLFTWTAFGFYQISSDSWVRGSLSVLSDKSGGEPVVTSLREADQLVISQEKQLLGLHRVGGARPGATPSTC